MCEFSLAAAARGWDGKRKIAVICALAILLASFGLKTLRRNQDWKDEERLYRAGIPINPAKGKDTKDKVNLCAPF